MEPIVFTYALYLAVSIGLTVWVARTLFRSGHRFLLDVFNGDDELAASVNHLLVLGAMHFFNLAVFSRMRASRAARSVAGVA